MHALLRLAFRPLAIVGVLGTLAVAGLTVARATDAPGFCRSCHEMAPYHEAWSEGPHENVDCVACHVDAGTVERLKHKLVALGELKAHLTGDPLFPLSEMPEVPDGRCVSCHAEVTSQAAKGFSHDVHAAKGPCVSCHAEAGHEVTTETLAAAGVWSGRVMAAAADTTLPAPGRGSADVTGHVQVACTSCHVLSEVPCSSCHTPEHVERGECATCHLPGAKFVFTHPQDTSCQTCHDSPKPEHARGQTCATCHLKPASWAFTHPASTACETCHARPAQHRSGSCTTCHKAAGSAWTFSHPGSGSCTTCHSTPAGHRSGACANCHRTGVSWAFRHPGSGSSCVSCHAKPSGHKAGACVSCHKAVGSSWAFSHPGSGSSCATCHARPSGHRSGTCATCHRSVGRSWAFSHPSGSSCSSCHRAPSGHYGTSCVSCHSPSRSWSSATFRHPGIQGGEHTYRSFACSNCHPSGYGSASCTRCHGAGGPDEDDDD